MAGIGQLQVKTRSNSGKPSFEKQIAEAGIQQARLLHVIHLGKQVNRFATDKALAEKETELRAKSRAAEAKGKRPFSEEFIQEAIEKARISNKVKLTFELVNDLITSGPAEGKPLVASKDVNVTLTRSGSPKPSDLTKIIEAILGQAVKDNEVVDVESLVGKPLSLIMTHKPSNGKIYANISGFAPADKGKIPDLVNEPIVILDAENVDEETITKLKNSSMKWVLKDMVIGTPSKEVDF